MPTSTEDLKAWQRVVGATPDGAPGPQTFTRTVEWFRDHGYIAPPLLPDSARQRVVAIARSYLGEQDPDRFWRVVQPALMGRPSAVAWCGGFNLAVLHEAGLCSWPWEIGKGFLYRLPRVALPEPGDTAYFASGQHHAIVERCANGRVFTIDGNSMQAPREGVVARERAIADVTAFYSIARLVTP